MADFNFRKTFLLAMIISLSISALIGIIIFLLGDFGEIEARILVTTLAIGGYSLLGLCCSTLYEKKRAVSLAITGMGVSVLSFLYSLMAIWEIGIDLDWDSIKILLMFIVLSFSIAHSCLLLLINSKNAMVRGSLIASVCFISIVAIMLILLIFNEDLFDGGFFFRLLGVFAILDVLGTIVTPILNKVFSS